mmetsp:Transcript_86308/g.200688  ORF Transcript_86308/g.200688 Transcript_86308/m.200688 type:complete len:360 (-) Transcript_86308:10-1089(-)
MRILALHGHCSDARGLRKQSAGLRRCLRHTAEFVFAEAQSVCSEGGRTWFDELPEVIGDAKDPGAPPDLPTAVQRLAKLVVLEGPFDVVFGFSQGAALCAALAASQQAGFLNAKFRAVILVAGYLPTGAAQQIPGLSGDGSIELQSLHIAGAQDSRVPCVDSEALARCFAQPRLVWHPGGHWISRGPLVQKACVDFLDSLIATRVSPGAVPVDPLLPCGACYRRTAGWADEDTGEVFCDECWESWEGALSDDEANKLWRPFGECPGNAGAAGHEQPAAVDFEPLGGITRAASRADLFNEDGQLNLFHAVRVMSTFDCGEPPDPDCANDLDPDPLIHPCAEPQCEPDVDCTDEVAEDDTS